MLTHTVQKYYHSIKGITMKLLKSSFIKLFKGLDKEADAVEETTQNLKNLRGVMTPEVFEALRKRNDARIKKTLKEMGNKWMSHKDNHVQRVDTK